MLKNKERQSISYGGKMTNSAQSRAYNYIKNEICAGRMAPGEVLDVKMISAHLQVSRVPVREAVFQLVAEGFLTTLPNRRVIITEMGPENISELFEMRAVLEGLAARRAAELVDSEAISHLLFIVGRMELVERQPDAWVQLHAEFHAVLCATAQYPMLLTEIQRLHSLVQPYLRLYNSAYERLEMRRSEHRDLVEILKARDSLLMEQKMREHITAAGQDLIAFSRGLRV